MLSWSPMPPADHLRDDADAEEDEDHGPGELGGKFAEQSRDLQSFCHVPSLLDAPTLGSDAEALAMNAVRHCRTTITERPSSRAGIASETCPERCSRSSEPPRSCACWPVDRAGWRSARSPGRSIWPRARPTASCARCRTSASSSRTGRPATTSSARPCCTWAPAIWTSTNCGPARSTGPTRWPRAAARRSGSAPSWRVRCWSCTTSSVPTTRSRPSTSARCCRCTPPRWARCCSRTASAGSPRRELDQFTRRTVVAPRELAAALDEVREAGWGAEIEELTLGRGGRRRADPGVRRPGGRRDRHLRAGRADLRHHYRPHPRLVGYVRDAARAVSRDLGAARH